MKQYLDLIRHIQHHGEFKEDRTGTGTYGVFGYQMRFDLAKGFPLVTTKKCHLKSIIHELLWFLKGETNTRYLKENGVSIWDEWADENGDLGPVYGAQWRSWPTVRGPIDQIQQLVDGIKANPDSRRHIVTAWNPTELPAMALPPCHLLFQFYSREMQVHERMVGMTPNQRSQFVERDPRVTECQDVLDELGVPRRALSCQLYQRSADVFLGVPFNIASYALLTMMVAQVTGHRPGEFIWTGGDCHLYANHTDQATRQISREPLPLPTMRLNPEITDLFGFRFEDFELAGYQSHPPIKAEVSV